MTIRIEDEDDSAGQGWRRLTREDVHAVVSMVLILQRPGTKRGYATGGDDVSSLAVRVMTDAILDRLMHYPIFGPALTVPPHGNATNNGRALGSEIRPAGPLPERPEGAEDALDRWADNLEAHRRRGSARRGGPS